jgi:hypothetical protein
MVNTTFCNFTFHALSSDTRTVSYCEHFFVNTTAIMVSWFLFLPSNKVLLIQQHFTISFFRKKKFLS